jgi:arsenate reductase
MCGVRLMTAIGRVGSAAAVDRRCPLRQALGHARSGAVEGTDLEKANAFREVFRGLERRIRMFNALPIKSLGRLSLTHQIREIGRS